MTPRVVRELLRRVEHAKELMVFAYPGDTMGPSKKAQQRYIVEANEHLEHVRLTLVGAVASDDTT